MKKFFNKYALFIGIVFILCLFAYITYCTPLCGDDWGYALNGMKGNPLESAINFYNNWSGRFFSELWGFVVAPRKWLWNIINPLLFTGTFYCVYRLTGNTNRRPVIVLLIIALMLSVDDYVRMETYSWIMGTTYVIPLFLSLVYFVIVNNTLFKESNIKRNKKLLIFSNLILFYIGLTMENIAAMMIVATLAIAIYAFVKKREYLGYFVLNILFSLVSFIIMRSSPGSAYRLMNDHPVWNALSLFEKLKAGYPNFIYYTFINNNYLILFLSIACAFNIINAKINIVEKLVHLLIVGVAIFSVFSFVIIKENNFFIDSTSVFNSIFWIIYTISVAIVIIKSLKDTNLILAIFFLCLGGGCNVVMMYSPIFGARCSLYMIYYLFIVICLLANNVIDKKIVIISLILLSAYVVVDRTSEYINKYTLVRSAQKERLEIIKYYQDHPEDKEAWIPRYPIYTVHSGDIEEDDTYHMDTFKEYYKITQDKLVFYYKD